MSRRKDTRITLDIEKRLRYLEDVIDTLGNFQDVHEYRNKFNKMRREFDRYMGYGISNSDIDLEDLLMKITKLLGIVWPILLANNPDIY